MSATFIELAINNLGSNLTSLIKLFSTQRGCTRDKLFPEDDEFTLDMIKGLELRFYEKTERLEAVFVTLKNTGPLSELYVGALPEPYKLFMDNLWVRDTFGEPQYSQGPKAMPKPLFPSGGWDIYRPADKPNIEVHTSYSENMEVCSLAFMLIDTGRS